VNFLRSQKSNTSSDWLSSFAAACVLTLAILLLLSFAHREQTFPMPTGDSGGIRLETIESQDESNAPAAQSSIPNLAASLPTRAPTTVSPLAIEAPTVDVSVDLSQMIQWRYSYADMGSSSAQAGTFGISNFSDVDKAIQNIVIPPKTFPDQLIDAGILRGRVVVKLMVDEQGRVKVMNVLSSTHPLLVPPVVEAMNRSVYSVPMRDGRPTKAIINRTVVFNADPEHVARRQASNTL
jgi:outer membrane biosynthesis protein TonB